MRGDCMPSPDDCASQLECLHHKDKAAMGSVRYGSRCEWSRLQTSGAAPAFSRIFSPQKSRGLGFSVVGRKSRKSTVCIFDAHCRKLSLCFWSEVPLYQQQYACPASFSHTPLLQASLFIKGQQDVFTASSNGDVNLLHSHLITDPSAVYKKNRRYDSRCNLDCIL